MISRENFRRPSCTHVFPAKMLFLFFATIFVVSFAPPANTWDNGVALTPPMGWNSWNKFGCNVSEEMIKSMADAMVSSGMKDAGYQYVVIDDCWQVSRDENGFILADPQRFPSGMKALADYVHGKGLKFACRPDAPSSVFEGASALSSGFEGGSVFSIFLSRKRQRATPGTVCSAFRCAFWSDCAGPAEFRKQDSQSQ
jgi:hypothetical protein